MIMKVWWVGKWKKNLNFSHIITLPEDVLLESKKNEPRNLATRF